MCRWARRARSSARARRRTRSRTVAWRRARCRRSARGCARSSAMRWRGLCRTMGRRRLAASRPRPLRRFAASGGCSGLSWGPLGRAGFRINKIECCSALGSHPRRVLDSPDAILPESSVSLSVGSVFPWAHFPKTPPTARCRSRHTLAATQVPSSAALSLRRSLCTLCNLAAPSTHLFSTRCRYSPCR